MDDKRLDKRKKFFETLQDPIPKREKFMVNLRKKNKQKLFMKKRTFEIYKDTNNIDLRTDRDEMISRLEPRFTDITLNLSQKIDLVFDNLKLDKKSEDHYLSFLEYLEALLINFKTNAVRIIVESDYLDYFQCYFEYNENEELTLIITSIVSNMVGIENEIELINKILSTEPDIIDYLFDVLKTSDNLLILENAVYAGNMIGAEDQYVERMLQLGYIEELE